MHCPQCGAARPDGARACPTCGAVLAPLDARPSPASRTMLGVASPVAGASGAAASAASRTIVGMPAAALSTPGLSAEPVPPAPSSRTLLGVTPGIETGSRSVDPARTVVGVGSPVSPPPLAPRAVHANDPSGRTMIGVAMPGIAPIGAGDGVEDDDPRAPEPAHELGATIAPHHHPVAWSKPRDERARPRRIAPAPVPVVQAPKSAAPRKAIAVVATAVALVTGALLFALFWPSPPPLAARVRADAGGREVVEIRCSSCPDGTRVSVGEASATLTGGAGELAPASPLSVGDNLLKVQIDRPGNGRDEAVNVHLNVAYRIRPDLSALQGDRPSIQVVVEAAAGTTVALDGKDVPLIAGRAIETIDVSDACTGLSDETSTLSRQIPYAIRPRDGAPEQGTVNVSVPLPMLHIDAPGPHAVIDGKSFVLAGRASRGAEVLAAGRPIPVRPDGTFAQTMNVSSVGATQIEVRARLAGGAPRLTRIAVRRVDSLDTAAREFTAQSPAPLSYAAIAADMSAAVGKAAVVTGEVIEVRALNDQHQTIVLLSVPPRAGCTQPSGECHVRLVQGSLGKLARGDVIAAYGWVATPFAVTGKPPIPELQVDFTTKGAK